MSLDLIGKQAALGAIIGPVVWFSAIAFAGGILSVLVWIGYYTRYEPRPDCVKMFSLSLGIHVALYFAYLRFMKFMERP